MKLLLVLAAVIGVTLAQTTPWPEHNCLDDHDNDPANRHNYRVKDGEGGWTIKTCNPPHLVFNLTEKCFCGWPDPILTYGDCWTVNRISTVSPGEDYMYEYWDPVLDIWVEKNCHDTFPPNFNHQNLYLFYNETCCCCDWKPGHPEYFGPPATEDCTLDMDIVMNKQPPDDSMGSFVQPFKPLWIESGREWPPQVEIGEKANRNSIRCDDTRLKSWFLQGNEKKDIWFYFGLYSENSDNPGQYRKVLADSCARLVMGQTVVYQLKFCFEYRASDRSFRVTYMNGVYTCSAGGSGVGRWVDVVLNYQAEVGFFLYVDGNDCGLNMGTAPDPFPMGANPYFRLHDVCELNLCGDPLDPNTKYTGYMSTFQEKSGARCEVGVPSPSRG